MAAAIRGDKQVQRAIIIYIRIGSGAGNLPIGRIAAGAVRRVEVELRTVSGSRLGFRWTAAAI